MPPTAEQAGGLIGESRVGADRVRNASYELSCRLHRLWRYEQYIANAQWQGNLRLFWEDLKVKEQFNIRQLEGLLGSPSQSGV
jgi:hypothetical protein